MVCFQALDQHANNARVGRSSSSPYLEIMDMSTHDPYAVYRSVGERMQDFEVAWQQRQPSLARHGYMLRPRYHPDWVPSWKNKPDWNPMNCEDFHPLPVRYHSVLCFCKLTSRWQVRPMQVDATRISDGKLVYIKRVHTESSEVTISKLVGQELSHPQNHCVPLLDSFLDDDDHAFTYLVMPFLRRMNSPSFDLVNDIIQFADEVLEVRFSSIPDSRFMLISGNPRVLSSCMITTLPIGRSLDKLPLTTVCH